LPEISFPKTGHARNAEMSLRMLIEMS